MATKEGHQINTKQQGMMRTPLGEFQIGKTLGEGSYGKVKLIVNVKTNEKLAVKIIKRFIPPDPETGNKGRGGKTFEQRILREANLTRFLRHSHIVPLKDCRITKSHFYLFHEYIQGSQLTDRIGRNGLKVELAAHYFEQIIDGIGYCHSNFVVHRDIKVENIMIDKDDNVKIIDFGLANFFDQKNALKTFCGSLQYSAPEIMRGDPYIGPEVDIWSIGVVLFAMLTGTLPFDDPRNPGAWECVMNGKIRWSGNMAQSPKSLITRLLDPNPKRRIVMTEIVRHPFVNKKLDVPSQYRPSNFRTLPLQLDMTIIGEMTACMFQSEYTILQQLEGEMKKGTEQDGVIVVANSPLVAVYHLIANTREPVAPPKPKDPKPRSRSSNLESKITSVAPPSDAIKELPTKDAKEIRVKWSKSSDIKNDAPTVESVSSDEIPLAIPRKEANQTMQRAATETTPTPDKLSHRTYSENGALRESKHDKPKLEPKTRPRSQTIGGEVGSIPESAGMTRLNSDGKPSSSGSDGHYDKESYKAKRASMYETYKKMNAENTLNSTQRREQYLAKRDSLYDGLYKGPDLDDSSSTPVEEVKKSTGTQPTIKRKITLFRNRTKNNSKLKLMTKEERQEMLKNRLRQHLEMASPAESKSERSEDNENEANEPESNTSESETVKPSQEDATHDDKLIEPKPIEKTSIKPAALLLSVPEGEISTELRSPFLSTSPVVKSPARPRVHPNSSTPDSEPKEPRSLPVVSNQRRYLDKILNSYRSKAYDLSSRTNKKSSPSQTTRASDRSRAVLSDMYTSDQSSRSATVSARSKKKVTFYDHPVDTPDNATLPRANEIFQTLNQSSPPAVVSSGESSDEIPIKEHDVDFGDGKVSLFKPKTADFNDIVNNIVKNEAKCAIPHSTNVTVRHVEVPPVGDVTTALGSLLGATKATPPPLPATKNTHPTVGGDFDVVPGVPQVSITECLRSNVIKIAKINISSLSDQFLDTLATNQIDYEWLETAFDFLILIPYSFIVPHGYGLLSVTVEMVHITRARSSAILLKDCQLGSVDSQTVDPQYSSLVKTYLQSLF